MSRFQIRLRCLSLAILLFASLASLAFANVVGSADLHTEIRDALDSRIVRYAILDTETQSLIDSERTDDEISPAGSLRNLMTAQIASKELSLSRKIEVGEEIDDLPADALKIGLLKGDQVTVKDLITTMLLYGAQDSAIVLAANLADSPEAFVKNMNDKAKELGMNDTVYAINADDESEKQTIHDLLILGTEIMENNKILADILGQPSATLDSTDNQLPESVANRVAMLDPADTANYDQRVTIGFGYATSELEISMLYAAKCGDNDLLIATSSSLSKNGNFRAAKKLMDLLDKKEFARVDCADAIAELLTDLKEEGKHLQAEIGEKQLVCVPAGIDFDPKALTYDLTDKTKSAAVGERYATAAIRFDGETVATVPVFLAESGQASGNGIAADTIAGGALEAVKYTQSDETYFPTTYDQYGWILWSAAAIVFAVVAGFVATKILKAIC